MRPKSLFGKLGQLRRARPALWLPFLSGWLRRRQNGFVPCVVAGSDRLLRVPLNDFYESYAFFCESPQGCRELNYFFSKLEPHEIFYDVGAFRGAYSVMTRAKLPHVFIHVFEPLPQNVESLRRISQLNGFTDFIINPLAVGGGSSLSGSIDRWGEMFRLGDQTATTSQQFSAITLDEYIMRGAPAPTVVKIDVDGFELHVLGGARECLRKYRPHLWLEIHPEFLKAQGKFPDDVLNLLREMGYTISFFEDINLPGAKFSYHVWCE